ncbi:Mce protein [Mycobacterium florentinum]|uniref:Mce protein n=2 Tax=Mycobacterium florentinum TaxID=292462 RepID=A0A1X1U7R9_MYCFL|nr:Mce protein [Mycobacterium florentinum]
MSMLSRLRRRRPKESDDVTDETNPEVTAEDSAESEVGTDQTEATAEPEAPEATPEPEAEAEAAPDAAEQPEAETEAASADDDDEQPEADDDQSDTDATTEADADGAGRPPSALGRAWLAGIAAALVLLAGAVGTGGYLALRYHHESQAIARNNAAALRAAIDCVSATQAPDTNAMIASEQKIIECGTGAFREQAMVYTGMLVQAYQSANVHVQVSDVRAAVERNNKDGSVEVLVAMRVKVATEQSQNETGYRLRVKMALDEGQYRIAKLDQVTK